MTEFTIKTHRHESIYQKPHFFILNKGQNSGKPLKEPCANCFVLLFNNEQSTEQYYWLAYSLWKSNYWHQFLIGSVIQYFRIDGFSKEFARKSHRMQFDFDQHKKQLRALQLLEAQEVLHREQIRQIKLLRQRVLMWYHK